MTKAEIRALYKSKRANILQKDKMRLDDLLLIKFQQLYFPQVTTLLTFWPGDTLCEPNTHLFSGFLQHTVPGLEIAYPVIDINTGIFKAVLVNEGTAYITNKFGIAEPKEGVELAPDSIGLVFVPLLACDMKGYRVGYGKGFYDKYLALCREDVIKVGFNYFEPVHKIDDTAAFDVPLDYCITPENIYEF